MRDQVLSTVSIKTNGHNHSTKHSSSRASLKHGLRPLIFQDIPYVYISWDRMGEYTFELAQQILASGQTFDSIIALAKGGWTWARALSDYLCIDHISSVRYKSYSDVNQASKLQMIQPLTESVSDRRVLMFDDVIDSGHTAKRAKTYLKSMGAKQVKVAMLGYKPRSIVMPDFFAFETSAWIIFPHEIREFIEQSYARWSKKGISKEEMLERFEAIGIPSTQAEYFMKLR